MDVLFFFNCDSQYKIVIFFFLGVTKNIQRAPRSSKSADIVKRKDEQKL